MGILSKTAGPELKRLPAGTFTIDASGEVVSSTVPQIVSEEVVSEIGRDVLAIFQGAREAGVGFSELAVQYAAFKIVAREMRGGAIIFLSPKARQLMSRT
jgi:hypothetical protein